MNDEIKIEKDMTPKLVGELYMKYPAENSRQKYRYGLYECAYCGKEFEANSYNIKYSKVAPSCGCQQYRPREKSIKHNLAKHRFYNTWAKMVYRCSNPNNKDYMSYGGRGISVCEEWLDVRNFIEWAEATHPNIEGMSLDRIDNDKGYSPDNCRWANKTLQGVNQRIKKNNTSGFVGIYWNNKNNNWRTFIHLNTVRFNIGSFHTKEEAVLARDNYIIENNLPHKLSTDYKKEN